MLGQGLKPCDLMLVVEFLELSWPVLGLCWPFGPSWRLRRPMLGSMLALSAHLGPILGPCWGLCWPESGKKRTWQSFGKAHTKASAGLGALGWAGVWQGARGTETGFRRCLAKAFGVEGPERGPGA